MVERIQALRPVYVSEIANHIQPPERVTYKIQHKYPKEATMKAVRIFEEKMESYLQDKNWGFVK